MSSRQTYGSVFRAEFKRIFLRQKTLAMIFLFILVTVAIVFGSNLVMDWATAEESGGATTSAGFSGIGLPAGILSFLLGIFISSVAARDYADGSAAATLVVVPRRGRLASARMLTWVIISLLTALVTFALCILVSFNRVDDLTRAGINAACGAAGVTAYMMLAYACASLTRKGSLGVLCFFAFEMVIPSVLGVLGSFGPDFFQEAIAFIAKIMPSSAISMVCETSLLQTPSSSEYLIAAGAMLGWALIGILLSRVALMHYRGSSE